MAGKRKDNKGRNLRTGESQRKDGRYMYRWTVNGKEKTVYALTLSELREKESQIQRDAAYGINTSIANSLLLNDMYDRWLSIRTDLRPTSKASYISVYETHIKDGLGQKKLSKIKYSDLYDFFRVRAEEKCYKERYLRHIYHLLNNIFEMAVKDEILRKNPCSGVFSDIKKKYYKEKSKRHSLTLQEQSAFIEYVKGSKIYAHWLPMFTVFFGTGGRCGEILGLRWEASDFDKNVISINHSIVGYTSDHKYAYHISEPKTEAGKRKIPMLSAVRQALLQVRQEQYINGIKQPVIDGYTDFCFLTSNGTPFSRSHINKLIKSICQCYNEEEEEKAGREDREPDLIRPFSMHNIRHTFASRFCEHETNLKAIQEIMGHANIVTTMNIYAEATEEAKEHSIKNLEGNIKIV